MVLSSFQLHSLIIYFTAVSRSERRALSMPQRAASLSPVSSVVFSFSLPITLSFSTSFLCTLGSSSDFFLVLILLPWPQLMLYGTIVCQTVLGHPRGIKPITVHYSNLVLSPVTWARTRFLTLLRMLLVVFAHSPLCKYGMRICKRKQGHKQTHKCLQFQTFSW